MENIKLPPAEILYDYDDELTHIYFPGKNTVVSFLCRKMSGRTWKWDCVGTRGRREHPVSLE
jgi:hypothetical protein